MIKNETSVYFALQLRCLAVAESFQNNAASFHSNATSFIAMLLFYLATSVSGSPQVRDSEDDMEGLMMELGNDVDWTNIAVVILRLSRNASERYCLTLSPFDKDGWSTKARAKHMHQMTSNCDCYIKSHYFRLCSNLQILGLRKYVFHHSFWQTSTTFYDRFWHLVPFSESW